MENWLLGGATEAAGTYSMALSSALLEGATECAGAYSDCSPALEDAVERAGAYSSCLDTLTWLGVLDACSGDWE